MFIVSIIVDIAEKFLAETVYKLLRDRVRKFCPHKKDDINQIPKMTLNVNKAKFGSFGFDCSNHNGVFIIGESDYQFDTQWSKASNTSIHAYSDQKNIAAIALIKKNVDLHNKNEIRNIKPGVDDLSSRCRCPKIGQSVFWKNIYGKTAITKVLKIQDDDRGDDSDWLVCEYIILC